jgi:GTPase Era involved in 16S rRNA processing
MDVTSPTLICANKVDRMSDEQLRDALALIHKYFLEEKIIPASVKSGENLDMLLAEIGSWISDGRALAKPQNPLAHD